MVRAEARGGISKLPSPPRVVTVPQTVVAPQAAVSVPPGLIVRSKGSSPGVIVPAHRPTMTPTSAIGVPAAARMDAHPLSMATPAARKRPAPHHRPSLPVAMALAHVDPDGRRPLRPVGSIGAVGELQCHGMPAAPPYDLRLRLGPA